jgi:hypothetical protein
LRAVLQIALTFARLEHDSAAAVVRFSIATSVVGGNIM